MLCAYVVGEVWRAGSANLAMSANPIVMIIHEHPNAMPFSLSSSCSCLFTCDIGAAGVQFVSLRACMIALSSASVMGVSTYLRSGMQGVLGLGSLWKDALLKSK